MTLSHAAVLLRTWRGERSQTDAAALLGLDQARYSQWERGVRKPGRAWAVRIETATTGHVPVASWDAPAPEAPTETTAQE